MIVLSAEQGNEACGRYIAGGSCAIVARSYGVSASAIWGLLKRRGIPCRTQSQAQTKPMLSHTFGRLTVIRKDGVSGNRQARWLCRCICGNEKTINGSSLRRGDTVSCGCFLQERRVKHGKSGTAMYKIWESAKHRAKSSGIEFSLTLSDISIPQKCPVLGIDLRHSPRNGKVADNSPTLDRIDPKAGYIPGNIAVISHRANSIKRSATIEELEQIIAYMKSHGVGLTHELRREAVSEMT